MPARPSTQRWLQDGCSKLRMLYTEWMPPDPGALSSQNHLSAQAAPAKGICPKTDKFRMNYSYFKFFYKAIRKLVMLPSLILMSALAKHFSRAKNQVSENVFLTRWRLNKPVGAGSPAAADRSHPVRGPLHHHLPWGEQTKHSRSPSQSPPHQDRTARRAQHCFPSAAQCQWSGQSQARWEEGIGPPPPHLFLTTDWEQVRHFWDTAGASLS